MAAKQLTYEGVLKMFRKTDQRIAKQGDEFDQRIAKQGDEFDRSMKEQRDEFDRRMKENERMSQETDRKIREVAVQQAKVAERQEKTDRQIERMSREVARVSREIGRLGGRIGDIIEHMVGGGNIVKQFRALNYDVTAHYRNKIFGKGTENYGEIDLILEDGDVAILVSVKTKLTTGDVREHIEQLEKYRRHVNAKGHGDRCRFIGAVASAVADQNVIDFAQRKGFYVIVQSGVAVEIIPPPEGFSAKEW